MKKIIFTLALLVVGAVSGFSQTPGLDIGNKAPELNFLSPAGKSIPLSSLKGKVVLIDFWASWCGPCRRENPNVVAAYTKFKDKNFKSGKGFSIYSVSLDKDTLAWKNAIKQDKLTWPSHVCDFKWWYSDAAILYKVQSIPTNWLIDGNGVIIGHDLRGEALDQALQQIVK